jgi:hypothetical protein
LSEHCDLDIGDRDRFTLKMKISEILFHAVLSAMKNTAKPHVKRKEKKKKKKRKKTMEEPSISQDFRFVDPFYARVRVYSGI